MKKHFQVEATVSLQDPANVNTKDRKAVRDWLNGPFFHHDTDYTIHSVEHGEEMLARVMYDLDLNLAQVRGADLAAQLDSLYKLAIQEMATGLGISPTKIWQLDLLVTDRP